MTDVIPVALITGSAKRLGAQTARTLHAAGYRIVLHYRHSANDAEQLAADLNRTRPDSAVALQADLNQSTDVEQLARAALAQWQRLDALINNASSFFPTPVGEATEAHWDDLINSNLKAPFFLAQALAPALRASGGTIVNMADIHADRPLSQHPIYCAAKAGNVMLTKSLARELAPEVRVNGIAPGAILWPESDADMSEDAKQGILHKVPLGREGHPDDIARTILFLVRDAPYITGQIIAVDGGRSLAG
ncbi:pteridine reductase [Marinimicrobium alkaliphilum]|uniref:pteridine reductase n=1 Tax=Marinimicrobium alkaliphilum TaxID=2202654 RepID=UPI0018E0C37C|nr:pteridine reductase [Marinimicrobium alkaliphilum]